ncbi:hypothetical protein C8J56DRAFT_880243 [Mycena floridula]|nr:hypothetical protein C8J56DRAFT_880243 [Mycena floridula]
MVSNASFNVHQAKRPMKDLPRGLDHGRVRQDPSSGLGYIPVLGDHPEDLDMQIFYPSVPDPSRIINNGRYVPFAAAPGVSQSLSTLKKDSGNMPSAPSDGKQRIESSGLPVAPESTSSPISGPGPSNYQSSISTTNAGSLNNQAGIPSKPFECTECGERFVRRPDWNRHLVTKRHMGKAGDGPYLCPGCNTEYTRKDSVPRHQRETGCKPGNPKSPRGPTRK